MRTRLTVLCTVLILVCGLSASSRADLPIGSAAPAFIGSAAADEWINATPLTWKDLRGKVVLVDFWEYTCVNCIRTDPYLRAWYNRYKPYGFVIIGIQTPEFAFSAVRDNVAAAAKRDGLMYPILNDPQSKNWKAYNENYWPSKYLFDQDGRLVYQLPGEGQYQDFERRIQQLLKKSHPGAKFPPPLPPVRPGDRPGVVCQKDTEELYANPAYGFLGNLPAGRQMDKLSIFVGRGGHQEGKIYASGPWITRYQSLQHARATTDLRDYIVIRYRGTEVNVVVNRPNNRDYRVYVNLDGKPVPQPGKGDDLRYDSRGSYFAVDAPRMFNVYRGAYGAHELRLASDSPDFDLYSYTFSGCPQR